MFKEVHDIAVWRRIRKISQVKLASMVGVSPTTIAIWENDPDKIPTGKLKAIISILEIDVTQLTFFAN